MSKERLAELRAKRQQAENIKALMMSGISESEATKMLKIPTPEEEAAYDKYAERVLNKEDNLKAGRMLGLNQESNLEQMAKEQGIDLTNPDVQTGIKQTQALKAGTEFAIDVGLTAASLNPLGAGVRGVVTTAKALNMANKARKVGSATKKLRLLGDAAKGAATAAGANIGTNLGAAAIAEGLGQEDALKANIDPTLQEAGITATAGGILGGLTGVGARTAKRGLGAKQLERDLAQEISEDSRSLTARVNKANLNAVDDISKIAKQRNKELSEVTKVLNKYEDSIINNKRSIPVTELPSNYMNFIDQVKSGIFDELVPSKDKTLSKIKRIFRDPKPKVGPDGELIDQIKTVKQSDLLAVYKDIDNLRKLGADDPSGFGIIKGVIERGNIDNIALNTLPKEYGNAVKGLEPIYKKYGSVYDSNFNDLNKVYDAFRNGTEVSKEMALKALNANNSVKASKIGSFVDSGLISAESVEAANLASRSAGEAVFLPTLKGQYKRTQDLIRGGATPEQVSEFVGQGIGSNANPVENILNLFKKTTRDMPDTLRVQGKTGIDPIRTMAKASKDKENILLALGQSRGQSKLPTDINRANFTKQFIKPAVDEAALDTNMSLKLLEGFDAGSSAPIDLLQLQALNQNIKTLGPQAIRQGLQSGLSAITGGKPGQSGY